MDTTVAAPARTRLPWVIGAIGLAVLLVGGLIAWIVWPRNPDRAPFDRAVANLAATEAVSYRTSLGGLTMRTRVTRHGDSIGSVALLGQEFGLLVVNGRSYIKPPTGLLPGRSAATGLRNRWIASSAAGAGAGPVGAGTALAVAPPALAERLRAMVDQATSFERSSVGDVDAFVAHAPTGDLYVTRDEPNQVLRLSPRGGPVPSLPAIPSLPPLPSFPSLPSLPSLPPRPSLPRLPSIPPPANVVAALERAEPGGGQAQEPPSLDVSALTPDQADQTYSDLADTSTELVNAADPNVQFTAQATGQIACGGACVVNAAVTNQVAGAADTTVVNSQVTAEMTATISVDGRPAGVCVSPPTPIPANGTGAITCSDPGSAAVATSILEQKKATAPRGTIVSVSITAQLEIMARAMTTVQAKQEVDRLNQLRREALAGRAPPSYPAEGIKVGQVNMGARQSGTTPPVRMDGLTEPWDDGDNIRLRIEAVLGGNLPENTAGIDTYSSADGGTAISVKTIDPRDDSYRQNPGAIGTIGIQYVNALADFRDVPGHSWNPLIPPSAISVWVLRYALPASTLSDPKIQAALERVFQRGRERTIVVQVVPIEG